MKQLRFFFFMIAIMTLTAPSTLFAAASPPTKSEATWRQRVSTGTDVTSEDIAEEIRFGREVAARVVARYGLSEDARLMKYVNLVGKALALSTNRQEIDFRFGVLNTAEINGYAAPGGYVFVTKGAIDNMQDESELAGVLAHEMAHITERHVVKDLNIKASDDSASSGLARVIGGSTEVARSAFSQMVDKAVDTLFKDGYRREDETQADKDAVLTCAFAGYDPSALVRYFERLSAAKGKQTEVLDKTHPSYETRIAWLKGVIADGNIDPAAYKTNKDRFENVVKVTK